MWNDINTAKYEGMIAETVAFADGKGRKIRAYLSRPLGEGPCPSLVLIPHMPGWDEWTRECARRFTQHGYSVLYRDYGSTDPVADAQAARAAGGARDDDVMADCAGSVDFLKCQDWSNGKVGVIGMCSGGRHAFLAACTVDGLDAAVDCWGGGVVAGPEDLSPARPVVPIDYTEQLNIPLLGIFGIAAGYVGTLIVGKLSFQIILWPSPAVAVGAFFISVALGILFGMYPAIKASALQPVEALRAE